MNSNGKPYIVGLAGALRANSSTEKAVRLALKAAQSAGASTCMLAGPDLDLPMFTPERGERAPAAQRLIAELRRSDGVILGSPGYHGSLSGLLKNALDYAEDLREDTPAYLHGRAVGCVVTAAGWQAGGATLASLRSVIHALRGWPTPLGVAINTSEPVFDLSGGCLSARVQEQLSMLAGQVVEFALLAGRCRNSEARALSNADCRTPVLT
jgi:FMN reductase